MRREGESLFLDVPEAVRAALIRSGVPPERCRLDGRCTACHPELFYSHRRDGPRTGRMAGIIGILEG
ncbi:MAG: laccase domain-containing protein [Limnochordaceae bacterium]|nr:laccase domain-containing protein [Limnochordaceae bacterium]